MKYAIIVFAILTASTLSAQTRYEAIYDQPQTIVLKPVLADLELGQGPAKAAIPVMAPSEATGWFYSISILPNKKKAETGPSLISQLKAIQREYPAKEAASYIRPSRSSRESNIYILRGNENANSFLNYQGCRYLERFIGTRSFTGYMPNDGQGPLFVCIENCYELKGVKVVVELVAVFEEG